LLCLFILGQAAAVSAAAVADLHRGLVAVENHGQAQLQSGTRQALAQVLVKVSGHPDVLALAPLESAVADASRYVQRYRYLRDDDRLLLEVYFDPESVNSLLRDAAAPLWTANRPALLLWLVVDDGAQRRLATPDSDPALYEALRASMDRRGVPLAYPLYDLQDMRAARVEDLWRLDELSAYRASRRYGNENVLIGRFTALPGERWMGDWTYLYRQDSSAGSVYGESDLALSSALADFVADRMGPRYAVAAGQGAAALLVRVESVTGFDDYSALLDVFTRVELVSDAWLAYLEDNSAVFRLTAQADADSLGSILALDRRLEPLRNPPPLRRGPVNLDLSYRWLP
jgi:hypothetical protein